MKPNKDDSNFRNILQEETTWPHEYMFKFIVLANPAKINAVESLFPAFAKIEHKPSRTGKYTSITIQIVLYSADEVIGYYEKAAKIEGIYAL